MRRLLAIGAILVPLSVAACGDDDEESAAQAPTTVTETPADNAEQRGGGKSTGGSKAAPKGTEIVAAKSQFGSILFGPDERAIYLFDKETTSRSECYGACAEAWPPVLTDGDPQAGEGIEAGLLGTTERDDGSTQVTYDGRPLYYYVDDPPGEVLCHGVSEFGGLWLVLEPGGNAVS